VYRSKFEQLLLINVAKRSGISEEHIRVIVYSLYKGIYRIMKDPHTLSIRLPFMGRFIYKKKKVETMLRKLEKRKKYLSQKIDGILEFNFTLYANLKYQYEQFTGYKYNVGVDKYKSKTKSGDNKDVIKD
jgi:hypothetical protein